MQKIARIFTAFLFLMLCMCVAGIAEETITLTTYYPAPYGAYEELTTTGNTNLATTSGNVGIGTTNPNETLEVDGTIRANTAFNINGTDGDTDTYTVVTNAKIAGPNIQLKTRTITVIGGIITDISDETPNWTNGPL